MPIREYLCNYCGHQFEELKMSNDSEDYKTTECRCGSVAEVLPAMIGGYNGATGGASTRPKNSTSMKSKKAFTKQPHPGNSGEPEDQLEFDFGGAD